MQLRLGSLENQGEGVGFSKKKAESCILRGTCSRPCTGERRTACSSPGAPHCPPRANAARRRGDTDQKRGLLFPHLLVGLMQGTHKGIEAATSWERVWVCGQGR